MNRTYQLICKMDRYLVFCQEHPHVFIWRFFPWARHFSWRQEKKEESVNCSVMSDSATPWTVVHQAPLTMGFSRQEYRRGWPFPSQDDLPDSGIKPGSPADSLPSERPGKLGFLYILLRIPVQFQHLGSKNVTENGV